MLMRTLSKILFFLLICSLTARQNEHAYAQKAANKRKKEAESGQEAKFLLSSREIQRSFVSCSELNLVCGGNGLLHSPVQTSQPASGRSVTDLQ